MLLSNTTSFRHIFNSSLAPGAEGRKAYFTNMKGQREWWKGLKVKIIWMKVIFGLSLSFSLICLKVHETLESKRNKYQASQEFFY